MRYIFTVFICKIFIFALRIAGRRATSAPGKLALKLYPEIGRIFSSKVRKEIFAVMGTNGKTTTNNLLADYFEKEGISVVCNRIGANMTEGVTAAFIDKCSLFGKLDADYAMLESDEAWANRIFDYYKPSKIIITNLFRDQLDRYGEIDITMEYIRKAIKKVPDAELILNADDPVTVASVDDFKNKKLYFGIEKPVKEYKTKIKDGQHCYRCGKNLQYHFYHFSQIGDWFCECGFKRPRIDFNARDLKVFPKVSFTVDQIGKIELNGRGLYNTYNVLASALLAYTEGIKNETIISCAAKYSPQIGRMEQFNIHGKDVFLVLAKNPAGFNQSVGAVSEDPRTKDVLIVINDGAQDGRDVSWLWDVDFEEIIAGNVLTFSVSGKRYADMALRLKYAELEKERLVVSPNLKKRAEEIIKEGKGETFYLLVNYTALFSTRKILEEIEEKYKNGN